MEAVPLLPQMLAGTIELRRRRGRGFPTDELVCNGTIVAELGRDSSFWIFFGRGRRVRLADGTEWRIKSTTSARHIVPIIKSGAGMIVISGPLKAKRSYGINGKDYGYTLIPLGPIGIRRPAQWSLRRRQTEIAVIDDRDRIVRTDEPIEIAAVLMAFTLITHGVPGEANLIPQRD